MSDKKKSWSVTSMVIGILGLVFVPIPVFGLPLSIFAIVSGVKGEGSMSTAGKVMGIIGTVFNALYLALIGIGLLYISYL